MPVFHIHVSGIIHIKLDIELQGWENRDIGQLKV